MTSSTRSSGPRRPETPRAYAQFLEAMSEGDRRIVAAHLMFALLHAAIAQFAALARSKSIPVVVDRPMGGSQVRISTPMRAAVCTCWLADDTVTVELLGDPSRSDWRKQWQAPALPDGPTLFAIVAVIANEIAVHIVGR